MTQCTPADLFFLFAHLHMQIQQHLIKDNMAATTIHLTSLLHLHTQIQQHLIKDNMAALAQHLYSWPVAKIFSFDDTTPFLPFAHRSSST